MDGSSLYDRDFYAWANEQASLVRARNFGALDIGNLVEEIESIARRERRELRGNLGTLLRDLLVWTRLTGVRSGASQATIKLDRRRIEYLLRDSPSLSDELDDVLIDAYDIARLQAAVRTGLGEDVFPADCPWSFAEMMDEAFWPDA
ncbi:DUF29 domain-containing protein [Azospirillum sp. YIM B02556]|uniref:DUF29 domain-containing protein n=1 Tax=Azospirillum endophyticum TaxID=2800326 RepID=A0ABS1F302_9PROT|nr:DUF29 domain-containing protein [Azospirillum endophyticum]MBK1837766.1 DUF29 domain-containing protein [Azospirillum endophyticum]